MYGIAIWAFVFRVAILVFPLRANERPLFESIMPVALVLAVTVASVRYIRSASDQEMSVALRVAIPWLGVNLVIDALRFRLANENVAHRLRQRIRRDLFAHPDNPDWSGLRAPEK